MFQLLMIITAHLDYDVLKDMGVYLKDYSTDSIRLEGIRVMGTDYFLALLYFRKVLGKKGGTPQ